MNFNKQQQLAIEHKDGACAVIASAGSGKSTVILARIENLIEKYNIMQHEILTISFTRNTADNLKKKLELNGYNNVKVGTFHSICMGILLKEGYNLNLIQEWECKKLFNELYKNKDVDHEDILSFIGYQKNNMINYNDDLIETDSKYTLFELKRFYKAYEEYKKLHNKYDLDDYLIECYNVLINNKGKYTWDYVLVDEHQDSNLVQNLLINEWCREDNLMVVGDGRQSIYRFRGSKPELFMNFYKDHKNTTVINLDINYRSCNNIVEYSNHFIKPYYDHYKYYSDSIAFNKSNGIIENFEFEDRQVEGKFIVDKIQSIINNGSEPKDIAVLYRNNIHADYIECELKDKKIPYEISNNSSFFKRKEIAFIVNILRLINNVHDNEAFDGMFQFRCFLLKFFSNNLYSDIKQISGRKNLSYFESFINYNKYSSWQQSNVDTFQSIINNLKMQKEKVVSIDKLIDNITNSFKIDSYLIENYNSREEIEDRKSSFITLKKFIKGNDLSSFLEYILSPIQINKKKKNAVQLMTIHKSKGLEFKNTFIIGIEDGKFPNEKSDIEEEARLMYVAVTRAKENLYLSSIYESKFVNEYMGTLDI
ncbi:ATP-dependent helicase [Anaerocolumna aminovalerica]|uniref:ATP-dependent helicase n=1 Tax=Anaerocolumna aminovalerica TaxID=1527 RepID=UPI001C0EA1A7|nr:ATP-dependent helicase [Anaerocolumna aminovalerica]MBU5332081.1 ATP-dependent helicase [Anaerocolumna aminovalerica]